MRHFRTWIVRKGIVSREYKWLEREAFPVIGSFTGNVMVAHNYPKGCSTFAKARIDLVIWFAYGYTNPHPRRSLFPVLHGV